MQKTLGRLAGGLLSRVLPTRVASADRCTPTSWCEASGCTNGVAWRIDAYRQSNCDIIRVYRELGSC